MHKPGWKTSELWIVAAVVVATCWLVYLGRHAGDLLGPDLAAGLYALARAHLKRGAPPGFFDFGRRPPGRRH